MVKTKNKLEQTFAQINPDEICFSFKGKGDFGYSSRSIEISEGEAVLSESVNVEWGKSNNTVIANVFFAHNKRRPLSIISEILRISRNVSRLNIFSVEFMTIPDIAGVKNLEIDLLHKYAIIEA